MRRLIPVIAVLAAFGLGLLLRGGDGGPGTAGPAAGAPAEAVIWTCSMHPQIRLPKPGKCPICFMDLIPVETGYRTDDLGPRTLQLSPAAVALAEIQTTMVERRAVEANLRLIGKIGYDETRYRTIAAWFPGRIDTLFVDFTGTRVAEGQALASVYSPELFAAQGELLSAVSAADRLQQSPDPAMRSTAAATVVSARERLRLWGLTDAQIAGVESRGAPLRHQHIFSPLGGVVVHKNAAEGMYVSTGSPLFTVADLSTVWLEVAAYESDLPWLRTGQTITFGVPAVPGRSFQGKVVFIDPVLDGKTRTARVRADVDNADGALKPGMFVTASLAAPLGRPKAGPMADQDLPLVIPASAPLLTGKRAVVYVQVPDQDRPTFEGREVVLGPRAGDAYIVVSGLAEGEMVVTKGNFKIDSALQIQAKPSMMSPGGSPQLPPGSRNVRSAGFLQGTTQGCAAGLPRSAEGPGRRRRRRRGARGRRRGPGAGRRGHDPVGRCGPHRLDEDPGRTALGIRGRGEGPRHQGAAGGPARIERHPVGGP